MELQEKEEKKKDEKHVEKLFRKNAEINGVC